MVNTSNTVHCVIVPIEKTHIVLPNTVVAEVVKFSEPEPIKGTQDWLLGHITWHDLRVPVIDYACLIGLEIDDKPPSARIMVVKSLLQGQQLPRLHVSDDLARSRLLLGTGCHGHRAAAR